MKVEACDAPPHVLDNAIWHALTTRQIGWSIGDDFARRFHPDVSPLAAVKADSAKNWRSLAALSQPGELVMIAGEGVLHPSDDFEVKGEGVLDQMILQTLQAKDSDELAILDDGDKLAKLDDDDSVAMTDLVAQAKPGPFEKRTCEIGSYYGLWSDGVLAAMAGERLRVTGHTEISTVCVHPKYRGKHYAERLVKFMALQIVGRGEVPFLHVFRTNVGAIALYDKLGFVHRRKLHGLTLRRR